MGTLSSSSPPLHLNVFFFILRILFGGFFLVVGVMKIAQTDGLIDDVELFQIFPKEWDQWHIPEIVAYWTIGLEIICGILILLRKWLYDGALGVMCLLCTIFVSLYVQGWYRGLSLSCNCLGVTTKTTNYFWEIGWRVGLLMLVLALIWDFNSIRKNIFSRRRLKSVDF